VKMFFKALRVILGPFMLIWEFVTRPKGLVRSPAQQAKVDQECSSLVLFQYQTCPFCIKVRQEMRRLSLSVEKLDAQHEGQNRDELIHGGGKAKVPCLRLTEASGSEQWIYESGKIIEYLRGRFSDKHALAAPVS